MKKALTTLTLGATLLAVVSIPQASASINIATESLVPPSGLSFYNLNGATLGNTIYSPVAGLVINATLVAPATYPSEGFVSGANVNSVYAAPITDSSGDQYAGTYVSTGTGTVTFTFATPQTFFGLLWGSVDASNSITFSGGNTPSTTFTGATLNTLSTPGFVGAIGDQGYGGSEYVEFTDTGDFNTVTLTSGQISFEGAEFTSNAATPEPAFYGLVGSGLAIFGTVLNRRRRKSASDVS